MTNQQVLFESHVLLGKPHAQYKSTACQVISIHQLLIQIPTLFNLLCFFFQKCNKIIFVRSVRAFRMALLRLAITDLPLIFYLLRKVLLGLNIYIVLS